MCFHSAVDLIREYNAGAVLAESWEPKGKFPPGIRPVLGTVALKAIKLNEYDNNFFNLMPRIFPYNRFTMSVRHVLSSLECEITHAHVRGVQKLIKRQIFAEHMALLVKRQDELLLELKAVSNEGFQRAKEEWERNVTAWGNERFHPTCALLVDCIEANASPAEKKQEKSKTGTASVEGSPTLRSVPLPPGDDSAVMDVDKSLDGEGKDS